MNSSTLSFWLTRMARDSEFSYCGIYDSFEVCEALVQSLSYRIQTRDYVYAVNFYNMHWIILVLRSQNYKKSLYMFDSLQVDLQHYDAKLARFVNENFGQNYFELSIRSQALSSHLCGHFCLYFAFSFCVLHTPLGQIEIKLRNSKHNDVLITNWYSTLS